ncbi:MAG: bifunctional transaldolase/phosoglucose isomerase [Bryobacterales bacterium]|nr:bifunctional transaldolase/phosoglucose isomerase [Bryobacterales bacterium]
MAALNSQFEDLPLYLSERVERLSAGWVAEGSSRRFWDGDESLWTSSGEANWLGWLGTAADSARLRGLAEGVRGRYSHALLLGMGGSSLCPEVLRLCFGVQDGFPDFAILDSTDPGQIADCEAAIDLESTLFLSASKSGSTLETALLTQHFLDILAEAVGPARAASQFVAITDPGSALESKARELGFGRVFHGLPSIGGRYSALSHFGMVPAAVMGLDVGRLLLGAQAMRTACGPGAPPEENPGVRLGVVLGAAALAGRDKLTFVMSHSVSSLAAWIEQLVAESTGKSGKGIVPVEGETLGEPASYASDRIFVSVALDSDIDQAADQTLGALAKLGHPVVRIGIRQLEDLGQEFFRWEIATAVAGAVLGINPFDQPDVESAKVAARALTSTYEAEGSLPAAEPFLDDSGIRLFADRDYAGRLLRSSRGGGVASVLRAHIGSAGEGDYIALLAYLNRNAAAQAALGRIRDAIRPASGVATCVGFGPRFLHSTGQLHKGGGDNGVFLQIGCDPGREIPVAGRGLSFGVVEAAQALGDFSVLTGLERRALRIHVAALQGAALARLEEAFAEAAQ